MGESSAACVPTLAHDPNKQTYKQTLDKFISIKVEIKEKNGLGEGGAEAGCIFCMMNQNCEKATEDNVGQKDSEHFVMNVISQWQTAAPRDSLCIRDMLPIQTFI